MESRIKYKAGQSGTDGNYYLRSKRIEIRTSPQEYEQLEGLAQAGGYHNLAQFVRESSLTSKDIISPLARQKERSDWLYAINRIGNNINQIARQLNQGKAPDDDMLLVLMQIQDMASDILKTALRKDGGWENL